MRALKDGAHGYAISGVDPCVKLSLPISAATAQR